jgi:hypothetical protein
MHHQRKLFLQEKIEITKEILDDVNTSEPEKNLALDLIFTCRLLLELLPLIPNHKTIKNGKLEDR